MSNSDKIFVVGNPVSGVSGVSGASAILYSTPLFSHGNTNAAGGFT